MCYRKRIQRILNCVYSMGSLKTVTADLQMEFEENLFKFGVIVSGFLDLWRRVFIASKIWKFLAGNIS